VETRPLPHEKLTDEEVKDLVSELVIKNFELRSEVDDKLAEIGLILTKLKRHFCPEKFQQVSVSGAELSELMMNTYGNMNMGNPIRMKKLEVEDDTPA
jgi:hypothetical protein